ncbi:MAG: peptidylprolyl isomerase [Pseudomonadota bacterium]
MLSQSKKFIAGFSFLLGLAAIQNTQATIVQFQTVMGNFEVNLYDKATPKTVENFLAYVTSDAYKNVIIHRSIPDFVIQGGGFQYVDNSPLVSIPQKPTVINEPVYANKRGTIAMAKLGGNPNSATNQWFFNLVDNAPTLDGDNGGFTVFGEVTGSGMAVLDAMAAVNVFPANSGVFKNLPLRNYTMTDFSNGVAVTDLHLIVITNILVLDANVDTAASLTPVLTTRATSSQASSSASSSTAVITNNNKPSGGGGGNIGLLGLLMLLAISMLSKRASAPAK